MATFLHRTTMQLLPSTSESSLSEPVANYIENPDLSAITGFPSKYWIITGDVVTLMDQSARDAVDAAGTSIQRDATSNEMGEIEGIVRAFALVVLDELNLHAARVTAILDAVDAANNLAGLKTDVAAIADVPQRTIEQLETAVRNKLGT